jgi:hypothetical protein
MSQKGRSALLGESNSTFPTNNSKLIEAVNHRLYNDDIIDSKFNLVDDSLNNITYIDGTTEVTLEEYLDSLQEDLGSLAEGTVGVFDVTGTAPLTVTGDFASATISISDISSVITVNFTTALADTNYLPIIIYQIPGAPNNQTFSGSAFISRNTNNFSFKVSEWTAENQSLTAYIRIVKFTI